MKRYFWICWLGALSVVNLLGQGGLSTQPGYVSAEFIVDNPSHASSHASTIIDTRDGLMAAWFGGTQERALDVSIFIAHRDTAGWSAPMEVADGVASIMPRTLVTRPFSPAPPGVSVKLGLSAVRSNPHAETFARLLREEVQRQGKRNTLGSRTV